MRYRALVVGVVVLAACSSDPKVIDTPETVPVTTLSSAATVDASASAPTTEAATESSLVEASIAATSDAVDAQAGHFRTLPVGSALPSDAECAAQVRPTEEIRPTNTPFNSVRGNGPAQTPAFYSRVTGDFTGTTDEIIQWAACKWGFDEDIVRAQAAKESGWFQDFRGDFTPDPANCVPGHDLGDDGEDGQCPESIGMLQTRYQYMTPSFPMAADSTAYNLDVSFAARRSCFEGNEPWLNDYERGAEYAAGDLWGCVGMWFTGRWHTPDGDEYASAVQQYLSDRIWETDDFARWSPP